MCCNYRTDIFGPDSRYLRIARPTFSARAKKGDGGLYTCVFCYIIPLGAFGSYEVCKGQKVLVNIISMELNYKYYLLEIV